MQTNLYAKQVMGEEKYEDWEKLGVQELKAYIGFSILMGLVRLPAIEDYWKIFLCYFPISDRIARQRFRELSRYIHFVDNVQLPTWGEPGYDKVGKVKSRIDHCSKVFQDSYHLNCECTIDEAMIPLSGQIYLETIHACETR